MRVFASLRNPYPKKKANVWVQWMNERLSVCEWIWGWECVCVHLCLCVSECEWVSECVCVCCCVSGLLFYRWTPCSENNTHKVCREVCTSVSNPAGTDVNRLADTSLRREFQLTNTCMTCVTHSFWRAIKPVSSPAGTDVSSLLPRPLAMNAIHLWVECVVRHVVCWFSEGVYRIMRRPMHTLNVC